MARLGEAYAVEFVTFVQLAKNYDVHSWNKLE